MKKFFISRGGLLMLYSDCQKISADLYEAWTYGKRMGNSIVIRAEGETAEKAKHNARQAAELMKLGCESAKVSIVFTTEEEHKKAEKEMMARLSGPRFALDGNE
jgi:hypothetical protein